MIRLLFSSLLISILAAKTAAAGNPPNIVFILADDLTWTDAGCYGNPDVHTPNIDALAASGLRFTHSYSAVAMCSPARQMILTGQYPVRSGAYPQRSRIHDGVLTLPVRMQERGYRVAMAGKQHYAPLEAYPFEVLSGVPLDTSGFEEFMSRDEEQPFFLYACSTQPHTPWNQTTDTQYRADELTLPPWLADTPRTRDLLTKYYAEVTYLDAQVGQVLAALRRSGKESSTLVMFCSEQGAAMPFAKWTLYDAGIRSQLIARWPGKIKPGTVTDAMVQYCDLLPTWIEATGAPAPTDMDGRSFLGVLQGGSTSHRDHIFGVHTTLGIRNGTPYPIRAVRDQRYKLIWNLTPDTTFRNNITTLDRKSFFFQSWRDVQDTDTNADFLVRRYLNRPEFELYDTEKDPGERQNLAESDTHQPIRRKLLAQLQDWMSQQGDEGVVTEHEAPQHFRKRH